jgi:hypothetical protein
MSPARQHRWTLGFVFFFLGICCLPTGNGLAEKLWLDELSDSLIFYKAHYPEGNWTPYIRQLTLIKEGVDRGNQKLISSAMDEFLMMLRSEAHGINGIAAHALYWIALGLQPQDPYLAGDDMRIDLSG